MLKVVLSLKPSALNFFRIFSEKIAVYCTFLKLLTHLFFLTSFPPISSICRYLSSMPLSRKTLIKINAFRHFCISRIRLPVVFTAPCNTSLYFRFYCLRKKERKQICGYKRHSQQEFLHFSFGHFTSYCPSHN